ncbi:MAG: hypothetical protein KAJ19_12095, partial [Gammaproteobacteria bacterium]|nr:hypothetical protein [Gammaproteobacteria bacterium]
KNLIDNILLLVRQGFSEKEAINLPMNKFLEYTRSAERMEARARTRYLIDLNAAIAGSLSDAKALDKHLSELKKQSGDGS